MKKAILILAIVLLAVNAETAFAGSSKLSLETAMGHPVLLADKVQTDYLKVGLTGFEMKEEGERAPVNIALVIDKSGSMSGEKIKRAKEAAIMAINRLSSNDIISVVTYDSTVNVLIPATKLSDKDMIFQRISQINAGGSTALYGGVEKGAKEVKKFLSSNRVNRIVLLSDGLANVGPESPEELGKLGKKLIKKGISVTTIGLGTGYNEDLMTKLAFNSDGRHYFTENARDLAKVFDEEFGQAMAIVAQEIQINIKCAKGIRPVRLLGRQGKIEGQDVSVFINQIHSKSEKYAILEVEIPASAVGRVVPIASVDVSYGNMKTNETDKLSSELKVDFTGSKSMVDSRANKKVMADVIELIAVAQNELALELRDKGQVEEAKKLLITNGNFLKSNAKAYDSKILDEYAGYNFKDAENLEGKKWNKSRKGMRQQQIYRSMQQGR